MAENFKITTVEYTETIFRQWLKSFQTKLHSIQTRVNISEAKIKFFFLLIIQTKNLINNSGKSEKGE